jgi:anti-sigma regulatory factor (Ser/Thr protein kinase)
MDSEATGSRSEEQEPGQVELPLPAGNQAPALARSFVRDRWPGFENETLDDITLIVSELVSNAVQHGEPEIILRMQVVPFAVDVSVLDHGRGVPPKQPSIPDPTANSGRGLSIVDQLASEWGVDELSGGKAVWARLTVQGHTGVDE